MKNWVDYSKQFLHKSREGPVQMCLLYLLQVDLVFLPFFLAEHNAHLFCFAAEAGAISLVWSVLSEVEGTLVAGWRASNVFKTLEMFWLIVFWSVDTQDRLWICGVRIWAMLMLNHCLLFHETKCCLGICIGKQF